MSGHSKWSTIKRKKALIDAKRGKVFTKVVREITTAARMGGGDPSANPRLRAAVSAAKAAGMPADNVTRAIKKGCGELDGPSVEEIVYEGYGPGRVALVVETQTDNRNRTTADVRSAFAKNGGNMGADGCVGWMFHKRGQFVFDGSRFDEEQVMEAAMDAGADDVAADGDSVVVYSAPKEFSAVLDHFEKLGMEVESAEFNMIPDNTVAVSGKAAAQVLRLVERLEDLDDVMNVFANFDMSEEELESLSQ